MHPLEYLKTAETKYGALIPHEVYKEYPRFFHMPGKYPCEF
jgi:hypothetical protein